MLRKAVVVGALAMSAFGLAQGAASAGESTALREVYRGSYPTLADCEWVGERGAQHRYWDSYGCSYESLEGRYGLWTNR
ncbi:hypothetical protein [Kibdelosporangium aridum]|uniref:hypothetical protein n=1 Tax=Kibdelosporangium aridum TaxID=2030 RepID=UPI0005264449